MPPVSPPLVRSSGATRRIGEFPASQRSATIPPPQLQPGPTVDPTGLRPVLDNAPWGPATDLFLEETPILPTRYERWNVRSKGTYLVRNRSQGVTDGNIGEEERASGQPPAPRRALGRLRGAHGHWRIMKLVTKYIRQRGKDPVERKTKRPLEGRAQGMTDGAPTNTDFPTCERYPWLQPAGSTARCPPGSREVPPRKTKTIQRKKEDSRKRLIPIATLNPNGIRHGGQVTKT